MERLRYRSSVCRCIDRGKLECLAIRAQTVDFPVAGAPVTITILPSMGFHNLSAHKKKLFGSGALYQLYQFHNGDDQHCKAHGNQIFGQ